jgi:hypothetical protein
MFLMQSKTPYNTTKVKYYTENHTFKAELEKTLLEAITIIWRWKSSR